MIVLRELLHASQILLSLMPARLLLSARFTPPDPTSTAAFIHAFARLLV